MKSVLLAVCGLAPQVITETLYALHQNGKTVDAVHVITTRQGKERIFSTLLIPESGIFHQYLEEQGLPANSVDFTHRNVHVVTDEHGIETGDIVTEEDNERLLGLCLRLAFRFTASPDTTVYFSLAGGRKTMSSCLALAAQVYARPQDRVYHVLVSPEFESNPAFFYPPKEPRIICLKDEKGEPCYKDTRFSQVNLVHLPFPGVRDRLSDELLKEPLDPGTLMLSLVRETRQQLLLDLSRNSLVYRGMELDMRPAHLALYAFFVQHKKEYDCSRLDCKGCSECFMEIEKVHEQQQRVTEMYRKLTRGRVIGGMSDTGITALSSENFNSYKSKIRKALLDRYGPYAVKELEIASTGIPPSKRYGILMDRNRIKVIY